MQEKELLTKKYLDRKYGGSEFPMLFVFAGGKKVFYANFSARTSYGRLTEDGKLAELFCDGWEKLLKTASKNDGIAFIPLKDRSFFSHAKLIPRKSNGRVRCYEVYMVSNDVTRAVDSDLPAALTSLSDEYVELFDTVRKAKNEFSDDPDIIGQLNGIEARALEMYNFRTDILEFMWKNLLSMREDRKTFDVLSLITVAEKKVYPFDVTSDGRSVAMGLKLKGNFDLYRVMLEETALILCDSTPDTARIRIALDYTEDRILLKLFKKSMKYRIGAVGNEVNAARRTPLLYFMENILGTIDVKADFFTSEDGVYANISLPRYLPQTE